MADDRRTVIVIGGGFAGFVCARHLKKKFQVTVVDAKEFFEYTPGILRAFVHPKHFDSLTFQYAPVFERMGVTFIWGEVKEVRSGSSAADRCVKIKKYEAEEIVVRFDYCVVASGCNFGFFDKWGESLWFPTVWENVRQHSHWKQFDERTLEGRRSHIMDEYEKLKLLDDRKGSVLIVGAGFIGVEWATEIDSFFPNITVSICDMLPQCLGPLPERAKEYCQSYMDRRGIKSIYGVKFNPMSDHGYRHIGIERPDILYIATGFKASCFFMPKEVYTQYSPSEPDNIEKDIKKKGPAGGGWIRTDLKLQVLSATKGGNVVLGEDDMGFGRIFAVGDCNMITDLKPIPKISYPSEEQAATACRQIETIDRVYYENQQVGVYFWPKQWPIVPCYGALKLTEFWWPWGSGMFATSLGTDDACFVMAATPQPGSGYMVLSGTLCAWQKWFIEWSKVDQCREGWIGYLTWVCVH
jgi:NADH dehydrogenase FAD-containing subunit